MINAIDWHRECLRHVVYDTELKEKDLERMKGVIERQKKAIKFRKYQIAEAMKEGKVDYDSERYRANKRENME